MSTSFRTFTITLALALCVFFTTGCEETSLVEPESAPLAASEATGTAQQTSNQKFTFTGVTLSDATITVENGVIEASSKDHKKDKNDVTACSYFTEDYQESLGYYASTAFASSDAEAVKTFCIDHFADRKQ